MRRCGSEGGGGRVILILSLIVKGIFWWLFCGARNLFYVLLTVHLISVLVNNQLDPQFFFRIYLFQFSTCFEHHCVHHQENQSY